MSAVTKDEMMFTSLNDNRVPLLCISLKIKSGKIAVEEVYRTQGYKPAGEISRDKDVPASIIGHWVEILSKDNKLIYRRYVQKSLPFNLENVDSKMQRIYSLEKYHILVPDLPNGSTLALFEQSLPAPGARSPQRKLRLKLGLTGAQVRLENS